MMRDIETKAVHFVSGFLIHRSRVICGYTMMELKGINNTVMSPLYFRSFTAHFNASSKTLFTNTKMQFSKLLPLGALFSLAIAKDSPDPRVKPHFHSHIEIYSKLIAN